MQYSAKPGTARMPAISVSRLEPFSLSGYLRNVSFIECVSFSERVFIRSRRWESKHGVVGL